MNSLIFAHLDINLTKNKFESFVKYVYSNVDLLMILEKKLTKVSQKVSFPKGFCDPFRIGRNIHKGGILFLISRGIPANILYLEPFPAELFFVEINLLKIFF